MSVHELTDIHRRARSQEFVDFLDRIRGKADSGELVGAVVLSLDHRGVWRYDRNMFHSDLPTLIGYLEMLKVNLLHKYLTGETLVTDSEVGG